MADLGDRGVQAASSAAEEAPASSQVAVTPGARPNPLDSAPCTPNISGAICSPPGASPLLGLPSVPYDPLAGQAIAAPGPSIGLGASPLLGSTPVPFGPPAGLASLLPENPVHTAVPSEASKHVFDPSKAASVSMKYTYQASADVAGYVEKHFRRVLDDSVVKEMATKDPRPDTAACQVPTVDESMSQWLGDKFPRAQDTGMFKLQQALLTAAGPLTQLWDDIIFNNAEEVPSNVVLDALQRALVLIGHANAKMSVHRRTAILEAAGNKQLSRSAKDVPLPSEGATLFGSEFFKELEQRGDDRKTLYKATAAWSQPQGRRDRVPDNRRPHHFSAKPWQRRAGASHRADRPFFSKPHHGAWNRRPQPPRTSRPGQDWRRPPTYKDGPTTPQ